MDYPWCNLASYAFRRQVHSASYAFRRWAPFGVICSRGITQIVLSEAFQLYFYDTTPKGDLGSMVVKGLSQMGCIRQVNTDLILKCTISTP